MMEDCTKRCMPPEDTCSNKNKFVRNLWLAIIMLALFAFTVSMNEFVFLQKPLPSLFISLSNTYIMN